MSDAWPFVALLLLLAAVAPSHEQQWSNWGGGLANQRFAPICVNRAALRAPGSLQPKFTVTTNGTVYSTPTTCGNYVYAVDSKATMYKISPANPTSPVVWKTNLKLHPKLASIAGVRSSPVYRADCAVLYTFTMGATKGANQGVYSVAINTTTGEVMYANPLDTNPYARATGSPTYYNGSIFIGMSSTAESVPGAAFQGALYKVNPATGAAIWKALTVPPIAGYSGNPVWGSAPAIDGVRNQVCVGTGNNYALPATVMACLKANRPNCVDDRNMVDALVCFDITTGAKNWGRTLHGLNVFNDNGGTDYDFAQAPVIVNTQTRGRLLIAASKAGTPFALSTVDGTLSWKNVLSVPVGNRYQPIKPGASSMFGSCVSGRIFVMGVNYNTPGANSHRGYVAGFDIETAIQRWIVDTSVAPLGGGVYGPISCTKNVAFVPLMNDAGSLLAVDVSSGEVLTSYNTGKTLFCGPAIAGGNLYLGTGYPIPPYSPGNKFMSIPVPTGPCW